MVGGNERWVDAAIDDRGDGQRWLVPYCLMDQEYFLRFFLSDHDRCGMILFGMMIKQLLFAIAGYGGSGQPAMPIADHLAVLQRNKRGETYYGYQLAHDRGNGIEISE